MNNSFRRCNTQDNNKDPFNKLNKSMQQLIPNHGDEIKNMNIKSKISFKKYKPKLQLNNTYQSNQQLKYQKNALKTVYTKTKNMSPNSLNQEQNNYFPRATKINFIINKQDINFVPVDPNRLSRYNRSMTSDFSNGDKNNKNIGRIQSNGQIDHRIQKWDKSLQKYMQARTKMSNFFIHTKHHSGQFDHIQLDKKNTILRNRKLQEQKNKNKIQNNFEIKEKNQLNRSEFVSYLIQNRKSKQLKRNLIVKQIGNGSVKRCDALLVNFVGTYFRRKFYSKKNKKPYSLRRIKTDEDQFIQMIGLQGNTITDNVINDALGIDQKLNNKQPISFRNNQPKESLKFFRRISIGKKSEKSDNSINQYKIIDQNQAIVLRK